MANLTIAPASVLASSTAVVDKQRNAGETFTAGQVVYLKASDNKYYKASSTAVDPQARIPTGISLCPGAAGQPCAVALSGPSLMIGTDIVAGTIYVLAQTAGGIAPAADLATGDYVSIIGVGTATADGGSGYLYLNILSSGVAVPE